MRYAGCVRALEHIGPAVQRIAVWNGERFSGNREWLVERRSFDSALKEDAHEAKITVITGRAERFERQHLHWRIPWVSRQDGQDAWKAAFLIDARGRAAHHGRDSVRRGPLTIALGQLWTTVPGEPGTQVASFPEGWAWFARDAAGTALLQLIISSATDSVPPRGALTEHYRSLLTKVVAAQDWLKNAHPLGEVFARYAHPQFNPKLLRQGYARVGDAAFAIDPLSGHGVYEAIGGGLALAATINTMLTRPEDTAIAERFYRERVEDDFLRMARIGRDFYRLEQRWPEQSFWRERSGWPDDEPAHAAPNTEPTRVEFRPVNVEGFITQREVIVTADHPRGIWQVEGVPLVGLWRELQARREEQPQIAVLNYAAREGLSPKQCDSALAWLTTRRLIGE
ncbi:MAG: FAD-dependent oxidoreductase [Candidatus Competibacteraceae bacterium]